MNLYGYKRCSTCRTAQKTLEENGSNVVFHDIVDRPPSEEQIRGWLRASGRPIEDFVNAKGTVYRERDLKSAHFSEDQWISELSKEGKLLKRPILVTHDDEVLIGYHEGTYRRLALTDSPSR